MSRRVIEAAARFGGYSPTGSVQGVEPGYRRPARCWLRLHAMCERTERLDAGRPALELHKKDNDR